MSMKERLREYLHRSSLGKDIWYWMHIINVELSMLEPDLFFIRRKFRKAKGRELNLSNPVTFDEKQLWLKLFYKNPLCVYCSDKYLVRSYVEQKGLGGILNKLYGVYDSFDQIDWDALPESFYLKTNHSSGCNVRCSDKSSFDRRYARKVLTRGLRHNYYKDSREWNYRDIDRKIIAEAVIETGDQSPLADYRFLCYGGKCRYLFIDIGTAGESGEHLHEAKRNVYDRDMKLLEVKVTRERFDPDLVKRPDNYEEMVRCAEILSGNFPFCRVDLYNVHGRIIFGEITFFHSGGFSEIEPSGWEEKLGKYISIRSAREQIRNNYMLDGRGMHEDRNHNTERV